MPWPVWLRAATPLCEHDEPRGGNQRFRMGMFTYRTRWIPRMTRDPLPLLLVLLRPRYWLYWLLALLVACGGGQDTAGVGTGGTGLKEGNATGFGSVFIDGVRYDNSLAQVQVDDGSGTSAAGHVQGRGAVRVRAAPTTRGRLDHLPESPALLGPVERTPDAQGYLQVMGQWCFASWSLAVSKHLEQQHLPRRHSQLADGAGRCGRTPWRLGGGRPWQRPGAGGLAHRKTRHHAPAACRNWHGGHSQRSRPQICHDYRRWTRGRGQCRRRERPGRIGSRCGWTRPAYRNGSPPSHWMRPLGFGGPIVQSVAGG